MAMLLVIPMLIVPTRPALASHFIAVEPRVDIIYDSAGTTFDGYAVTYATNVRLRLDHKWTSGGTFSPTLKDPSGAAVNTTAVPRTTVVKSSGTGAGVLGLQVFDFDFSGVTTDGVYTLEGSGCCDKSFVNGTSSGSFSGDVPIDGVEAGEHTLQLSGVGTDGYVRAANLGVVLIGDGPLVPTRIPAGDGPLGVWTLPVMLLASALGLAGVGVAARRRRAQRGSAGV